MWESSCTRIRGLLLHLASLWLLDCRLLRELLFNEHFVLALYP